MKRFAFIDVQNTETTTLKVLNFVTDNTKLFAYLRNRWECEKVFFYPGIQHDDHVRDQSFRDLGKLGAIVRPKYYFRYKNPDKLANIKCVNCTAITKYKIDMGYTWKCNCDVELTSDVLDHAGNNTEISLFSGDGDFEFLINKVTSIGAKVAIFSSAFKIKNGPRHSISRLSTKLRRLTQPSGSPVRFIELDNLRHKIS